MKSPELPSPDEAMPRARAALEVGDVVAARQFAERALAASAKGPVATEAEALLRNTSVPWDLLRYGVLAAACFVVLVVIAMVRSARW
jgi:hypothetical protein